MVYKLAVQIQLYYTRPHSRNSYQVETIYIIVTPLNTIFSQLCKTKRAKTNSFISKISKKCRNPIILNRFIYLFLTLYFLLRHFLTSSFSESPFRHPFCSSWDMNFKWVLKKGYRIERVEVSTSFSRNFTQDARVSVYLQVVLHWCVWGVPPSLPYGGRSKVNMEAVQQLIGMRYR